MSISDFTRKFHETLQKQFPWLDLNIADDHTIKVGDGSGITIFTDNAFHECVAQPEASDRILERYSRILMQYEQEDVHTLQLENILPVIKPRSYLQPVSGQKNSGTLLYESYNEDLIITYAEDTPATTRYLNQDELKGLELTLAELRIAALENQSRILTGLTAKQGDGIYMITAGGNYEASLILMEGLFSKENFELEGDFVVAIPNRDVLLLTGSRNLHGIQKIKEIATDLFETGGYAVSGSLYKWDGIRFSPWDYTHNN